MDKARASIIAIAVGVGMAVSASYALGLFTSVEYMLEDLLVSPKPVSADVIILAIDDISLQRIGQWPWPREVFSRALSLLEKNPPKAVGVDVIFSETSGRGNADDAILHDTLEKLSYPMVFPVEASPLLLPKNGLPQAGNFLKPLPLFTGLKQVTLGHVNLILDRDGIVRKFPAEIVFSGSGKEEKARAFAYEILKRGAYQIPDEQTLGRTPRIVYAAPAGSIRNLSFSRLVDEGAETGKIMRDKIVLIGATAPDIHDVKLTPFSHGREMPGVELQAQIVNMLRSGYRLVPLTWSFGYLWIFVSSLLPALFFIVWQSSLKPIPASIALGIGHIAAQVLLFEQGIAANMVHIHLAWIFSTSSLLGYRYFSGERERKEIKKLFGKYVSPRVLEEILKDPARVTLGGEEKEVTVLFSDIRGFTTLSEKVSPQELVRILNKYFSCMSAEIIRQEGVLDKYIGDAIMAFWGAPLTDPAQADHALRAAQAMMQKLEALNEELRALGDPEIRIGIGLHTGPAVVGNIGSEFRFDYTLIGDTVNVASRLEGLNKEHETTLILSESTKNKISGEYAFRYLGKVTVKGREAPLHVYTLP